MGEIRFSCERCGQQIVADASAAGLNAECPSCHMALVIPETDSEEDSEMEGAMVSQSEHTDTQLALAYVCEQLEAAREQCEHLSANTIRVQAELRSLLAEQRVHMTLLIDYRQRLRVAEAQMAGGTLSSGAEADAVVDEVKALEAPTSKTSQTTPNPVSEKTANMENPSERLEAELTQIRLRLEGSEENSRLLEGSCEELRRENAALIRALQSTNGTQATGVHVERVHEDNGLLRGIVSRQNALLEQWHAELAGFKRERLTLRILYALFGLCLIILAIIAVDNWPLLNL